MTSIYLIRHAEAEGNLYRIAQGQYDSILTDRGWRQVRALERRFEGVHIDAVYTSDLYRTCATSSAIYRSRGLKPQRRVGLREICVGDWEQKTWGEIARDQPEEMENFTHRLHLWKMEGAETPEQVRDRVLETIREIAAENDGKTIAIFSHGCAIRLVLATLQGYSMEELGKTPHGDNTAVSLLEAEGDRIRVIYRDDNSHLKDPAYAQQEKVQNRANALEPGLWFEPLRTEQMSLLADLVSASWEDGGAKQAFDRERLLMDAAERPTLIGYLAGDPVGVVQFGPEQGWISLLCIREDVRRKGYGVQLIGQAVQHWRHWNAPALRISLPENVAAVSFFRDYGFYPVGNPEAGKVLMEKNIQFDPEFLAH